MFSNQRYRFDGNLLLVLGQKSKILHLENRWQISILIDIPNVERGMRGGGDRAENSRWATGRLKQFLFDQLGTLK